MTHYKKTQYGLFVNILILLIAGFIIYASLNNLGSKPMPIAAAIGIASILFIAFLLFYKLTISIDDTYIKASFGIGLINRKIPLTEINYSSIDKVKMPWYYGIGLRLTPKGILYNVKFGDAIYLKSTKNRVFLVGTEDFETIKTTLLKLKN